MTHVRAVLLLCAALCCCGSVVAAAPDYPTKPVRIVVGFSAGGSGDTVARVLARNLGRPVGAGGDRRESSPAQAASSPQIW